MARGRAVTASAKFLLRPPPIVIGLLNAVFGLLLAIAALNALSVLVLDVLEIPAPPLRWIVTALPAPLIFVATLGASSGFAACAVLVWGTPRMRTTWPWVAACAAAFAICLPVALIASGFYWRGESSLSIGVVIVAFAACGAVMAYIMAMAARRLGVAAKLNPAWLAFLGCVLAGLGVAAAIYAASLDALVILPALWLGTVTYFCLKPGRKGAATAFDNGGPVA